MKFRQRYGRDSMGPFFDMDDTRWRTSIACLADEFEYLLAQPEQVIVVDLVKACFAKGRELHSDSKLRASWKSNQNDSRRLERTVTIIEQAMTLEHHCVCHWRNPDFREQIERAVRATPPHDSNQYLPGLI